MQHRYLTQACTRVVAGMFIGVLMAAAPGAFADEVSSFNQNASFSPSNSANPQSIPAVQNALQNANQATPAATRTSTKTAIPPTIRKTSFIAFPSVSRQSVDTIWISEKGIRNP